MQLLDAKVNWAIQHNNSPYLEIEVDKLPPNDDYTFDYNESYGLWLGMHPTEPLALFYSLRRGAKSNGFGGARFTLKMRDGTTEVLQGPWSSNESSINQVFGTKLMNASIKERNGKYPTLFYSSHITKDFALEALKLASQHEGVKIELIDTTDYTLSPEQIARDKRIGMHELSAEQVDAVKLGTSNAGDYPAYYIGIKTPKPPIMMIYRRTIKADHWSKPSKKADDWSWIYRNHSLIGRDRKTQADGFATIEEAMAAATTWALQNTPWSGTKITFEVRE